ncbi:MAG: hypothetical protein U0838_11605 [Chloroflexota bacterium]
MVGRAEEIAGLRTIIASRRSAVLIGEAGIGKSTLLQAATTGRGAAFGGALAMLRFIPYLPLARAVGPLDDADPASVAVAVAARVGDGVLVVDDLHCADDATLAILGRLTASIPVLAAVRTGDEGTERGIAAARAAAMTELRIPPLADGDAVALARRWRPELGASESRRLVARSGGNPLLVVELARAGVTTTLSRALEHRLRSLTDAERGCLELLAVSDVPLQTPVRAAWSRGWKRPAWSPARDMASPFGTA